MSNSNDSQKPDPTGSDEAKKKAAEQARDPSGGSSYDFDMFDEVKSYSDLPPVPQPESNDPTANLPALPARPSARRPTGGSFDFIDIEREIAAMSNPGAAVPPPAPAAPPEPAPLVSTDNVIVLPPVPPPADPLLLTPTADAIVLPPKPVRPPASTDIVIELPPEPPLFTPTEGVIVLPPSGAAPAVEQTVPLAFTMSSADIDLGTPTDGSSTTRIPEGIPASSTDLQLPDAYGAIPEGESASSSGILFDVPEADLGAIPSGFPASSTDLYFGTPTDGSSTVLVPDKAPASSTDLRFPTGAGEGEPNTIPEGFAASAPDVRLDPPDADLPTIPEGLATSSADIDLGSVPDLPVANPASDTLNVRDLAALHQSADAPQSSFILGRADAPSEFPKTIPEAFATGESGIDLGSVPNVPVADPVSDTLSVPDVGLLYRSADAQDLTDLGAVPPTSDQPSSFTMSALEALPVPAGPSDPSLDSILPPPELPATDPSMGSFGSSGSLAHLSVPDIDILYPADATAPPGSFAAGDHAVPELELPPEGGAVPASDSSVGLGDVKPVSPSYAWVDSDVMKPGATQPDVPAPPSGPAAPVFHSVPTDPNEGSDIFSGGRAAPVAPIEFSDVIAATAYGSAGPAEPVRASDVALTFDGPPGGSTNPDGDSSDLPMAAELADSSGLLDAPGSDAESIHDLPDPLQDPLFDSATLAQTPDLPGARLDDSADYGAIPTYSADASSILADLSELDGDHGAGDSSSVRVEAPGIDRTLTGSPAEGAFDLTVPDEPIPAGLFDDSDPKSGEWGGQSGSDLLDNRTSAEIDLDDLSGTVEPVDADLTPDQPSLTSAPSSIFSGSKPTTGSGSAGSGSEKLTPAEPDPEVTFDDADAAEFTSRPALNETAERPTDAPLPGGRRPSSGEFELPATRRASSGDFELPDEEPAAAPADDGGAGAIDWDAAAILADGDDATRGIPQDQSLSDFMEQLNDDSNETSTQVPMAAVGTGGAGIHEVSVDYIAESAEGPAMVEAKTAPAAKKGKGGREPEKDFSDKPTKPTKVPKETRSKEDKPARSATDSGTGIGTAERADPGAGAQKRKRESRSLFAGVLLGGLLAAGASAGVYFSGAVPNSEKTEAKKGPEGKNGNGDKGAVTPPVAAPIGAQAAFATGDTTAALKHLNEKEPATVDDKATDGFVRTFARVQALDGPAAADDAELVKARASLEAVRADAEGKPDREKAAALATVRLGVTHLIAGDRATARKLYTEAATKYTNYASTFEALLAKMDAEDAPAPGTSFNAPRRPTPAEAERILLSVTLLMAQDDPKAKDTKDAEEPEPGVHYWKAVKAGTDGKYDEAIDLIGKAKAAHVKRAKALAGRGLNPLTDPLEQMFPRACDEMAAAWKLRRDLYRNPAVADAIKKNGLAATLDGFVQTEKNLVTATAANAKCEKELTVAKADLAKFEKERTVAKADLMKLDKDVKAAEKATVEVTDKLTLAEKDLKAASDGLKAAQADAKAKGETLAAVAAELKPVKPLPEKWTPAELLAVVKSAAGLATGVDAQRIVKAEAAAKTATDKLAADKKAFTVKYDTDTKKLKDDHAAVLKKTTDAHALEVKTLKEANAEEVTKLTDKFKGDLKKQAELSDAALKAEQAKAETEKKAAAAQAIAFQKQLANAVTPGQVVDLWLPVLVDLRRPSDADPALAIAARSLASSAPGSEDEAKARTTTGMALLLKGDLSGARDQFQFARKSPAYKAAAGKYWTTVADTGLEAVDDPLAPYRQRVVVPPVDLKAAAKALDVGIGAYKAGKYDAAATALADAAKSDPSDPVAWYYLGAARWASGNEEQARKDFDQGAERERVSSVPARAVSAALAPIQGTARAAIDKTRP